MDAETNSVALNGVVVQARERTSGVLKAEAVTQGAGQYNFPSGGGVVSGNDYIVAIAPGRTFGAGPNGRQVVLNVAGYSGYNLDVRGWPAQITVRGKPGASVLLTPTAPYAQSMPPPIKAGSADAYTGTLDNDGILQIPVAGNHSYYLTCWSPVRTGQAVSYQRKPLTGSKPIGAAGSIIKPAATPAVVTCPS